jgi:hypothetical protein
MEDAATLEKAAEGTKDENTKVLDPTAVDDTIELWDDPGKLE